MTTISTAYIVLIGTMNTSIPAVGKRNGNQQSPDAALRKLLSALIRESPRSREEIAEGMTRLTRPRLKISKRMLDDWTNECHKAARFPAFLVRPFCRVTENDRLQRWAAGPRLLKLIEFAERQLELDRRRAELLKPNRQRKAKGKRPGK